MNRNITIAYVSSFLWSLTFSLPIWLVFFTSYLHFWISVSIFLWVLSGLISMVFEVLTWSWADRYGRKKLLLIAMILWIVWWSFYLWADKIYLFIISSIIIWFSRAISSGNFDALIHDYLEEKWEEIEFKKIQANQYILLFLWRWVSWVLGWYFYSYNELLPYWLWLILSCIIFILFLWIIEPKQNYSQEVNDYQHIKTWFNFLIENKKLLYFIFLWGFIFTWISNIYWFSYQEYMKTVWFNIIQIWYIYSSIALFSAFWAFIIKKLKDDFSSYTLVRIILYLLSIATVLFIYMESYYALIPIFFMWILSWTIMTVWNTYLVHKSPKTHKSTILSIFSMSVSFWYFIFSAIAWFFIWKLWLAQTYVYIPFMLILILWVDFIFFRKKYN